MASIFDRKNFSDRTLNVFELLGAYFTEIFYYSLYHEAEKSKASGEVKSITDGYKNALSAYNHSLKKQDVYKETIKGFQRYSTEYWVNITYVQAIQYMTDEFIPKDYQDNFTEVQRMKTLKMIVSGIIRKFIGAIVNEGFIKNIIDMRDQQGNEIIIKDKIVDCLILERDEAYHSFLLAETGQSVKNKSNKMIIDLQKEIHKLVKEKIELAQENQKQKIIMFKAHKAIQKLTEEIGNLHTKIAELEDENKQLQSRQVVREVPVYMPAKSMGSSHNVSSGTEVEPGQTKEEHDDNNEEQKYHVLNETHEKSKEIEVSNDNLDTILDNLTYEITKKETDNYEILNTEEPPVEKTKTDSPMIVPDSPTPSSVEQDSQLKTIESEDSDFFTMNNEMDSIY